MRPRQNLKFIPLIGLCFFALVFITVLVSGLGNTPYDTTDSVGRSMGFNDHFSTEHYGIILRNFRLKDLFSLNYAYEWILMAMFIGGAWLLASPAYSTRRCTRWFFVIQLVLFPFGWVGLFVLPAVLMGLFSGGLDRETFIDLPFIWCVVHPIWLAVAAVIAATMSGESLGPKPLAGSLRPALSSAWRYVSWRLD